eukprot:SAG31_NODE_2199_length_6208_cov_3.935996_1_plen_404_part_00
MLSVAGATETAETSTKSKKTEKGGFEKRKSEAVAAAAADRRQRLQHQEMAQHFFLKGQPVVALRYLQQSAQAVEAVATDGAMGGEGGGVKSKGVGYIEAEYALAVNLANTGCLLSQPPLCKFSEAAALEMKAAGTLGQQSENAALAFAGGLPSASHSGGKAAARRLEQLVTLHNVAVLHLQAGVGAAEVWWTILEEEVFPKAAEIGNLPPAQIGGAHSRGYVGSLMKSQRALSKLMGFLGVDTKKAGARAAAELRGSSVQEDPELISDEDLSAGGRRSESSNTAIRRVRFVGNSNEMDAPNQQSRQEPPLSLPPINSSGKVSSADVSAVSTKSPERLGESEFPVAERMRRKIAAAQGLALPPLTKSNAEMADETSQISGHSGHFLRQMNAVSVGMLMSFRKAR